jgi:signal transduction histidine kinase
MLFPAQGVDVRTIQLPIVVRQFVFSDRQPSLPSIQFPTRKQQYGIVSMVPMFKADAQLQTTGNFTADFPVNLPQTQGVVAAVLRTAAALSQAVESLEPSPVHVILYDLGAADEYLTTLPPSIHTRIPPDGLFISDYIPQDQPGADQDPSLYRKDLNASVSFEYGLRNFRLDCVPTAQQVNDSYSSTPLLIAVGSAVLVGICLLMLICGWLVLNVRRSNQRALLLLEANAGKNVALELLAEAKELAERSNRSKSDFLAFLCHELRNPLVPRNRLSELLVQLSPNQPSLLTLLCGASALFLSMPSVRW